MSEEEEIPTFDFGLDLFEEEAATEPVPKKQRFVSLQENELDSLVDGAQAKSTKYATKYAVSVFKGEYHATNWTKEIKNKIIKLFQYSIYSEWAIHKGITKEIHQQSNEELNNNLKVFYAEARNKDGGAYSRSTLLGFRNGIERYLNNPPFNRGIHLATDVRFQQSNQMLAAKLKNMRQNGQENIRHKPAISVEDLHKLKESEIMSATTPQSLLYNVWFHVNLCFCRRGREGQRNLTKSSFKFLSDENGEEYATMAHDEASKNHPGGLSDKPSLRNLVACTRQTIPMMATQLSNCTSKNSTLNAVPFFSFRSAPGKVSRRKFGTRTGVLE